MSQHALKKLGFSDKEIEIYLEVLKRGKVTPADLAKLTGINRSTVYTVAKELVKKGVVAEDLGGSTLYFVALPLEDLQILTRKKEQELEEQKKIVQEAMRELSDIEGRAQYVIPKIRFVYEEDLENHLYKQKDVWNESMAKYDNTLWGLQDHTLVEHYKKWIDWYWTTATPTQNLKLFSNASDIEKIMEKQAYKGRAIRFWNKLQEVSVTTWIHGDYVITVQTRIRPHYLVEIHDPVLADNMRHVFKGIWEELEA